MEEADLLCDKIAIMVEGSIAAQGASMDLKQKFGVGYRLTIVKHEVQPDTESKRYNIISETEEKLARESKLCRSKSS